MHDNKRTGYDKTVRNPRPRTLKRKNRGVLKQDVRRGVGFRGVQAGDGNGPAGHVRRGVPEGVPGTPGGSSGDAIGNSGGIVLCSTWVKRCATSSGASQPKHAMNKEGKRDVTE